MSTTLDYAIGQVMKLVSYVKNGIEKIGVLDDAAGMVAEVLPDEREPHHDQQLVRLIELTNRDGEQAFRTSTVPEPLSTLHVIAPLPRPVRNIICVGKNYRAHVSELSRTGLDGLETDTAESLPANPIFFTKLASSVIGPGDRIDPHSELTNSVDYEAELAVIIGRGGRSIRPRDAWEHIWGYTLINDVTARDLQRDRGQWFMGKSLDTFCPMGPWAVSADELDATDITLECWVNGELRQQASTKDLIFGIPELIADLSSGMTLRPGDVIATGTPSGVGWGFDPPRFLVHGDVVRVAATGMGVLENRVGPDDVTAYPRSGA
jgi:2-keto-4-pentenoate hydratase/2-oxohepta-3-ene-1,7-dioic acid hydratase in catechol pathway